jgi:acyl carrier protein
MSSSTADEVRSMLLVVVNGRLKDLHGKPLSELPDDYDLLRSGLIESLYLIELMSDVSEYFGQEIDFSELDPEKMTVVRPLCTFIAEQLDRSRRQK